MRLSPRRADAERRVVPFVVAGVTSVVGVGRHAITSAGQGVELLRRAAAARASHATACNAASSRSHAVFWLSIRGAHGSGADGTRLSGSLCLVDLAGRCAYASCCAVERRCGGSLCPPCLLASATLACAVLNRHCRPC